MNKCNDRAIRNLAPVGLKPLVSYSYLTFHFPAYRTLLLRFSNDHCPLNPRKPHGITPERRGKTEPPLLVADRGLSRQYPTSCTFSYYVWVESNDGVTRSDFSVHQKRRIARDRGSRAFFLIRNTKDPARPSACIEPIPRATLIPKKIVPWREDLVRRVGDRGGTKRYRSIDNPLERSSRRERFPCRWRMLTWRGLLMLILSLSSLRDDLR